MNYIQIPLQAIPSQSVAIVLNGQKCVVSLREMLNSQYMSVISNGTTICQNVLVQNDTQLVSASYKGFNGDIIAVDLQGNDKPSYDGWNNRWVLIYYYA